MTTIKLVNVDANRTLEIVKELRLTLRQHADFDYRFLQGGYSWETHETKLPCVEFTFYNPADATAFSLKYL
jgi:hypothetical protein